MKRRLLICTLIAAACLGGIVAGRWVVCLPICRDAIGVLFGRGHLLALVHGRGLYKVDLDRALAEKAEAAGQDRHVAKNRDQTLHWLTANMAGRAFAAQEKIAPTAIDREMELLQGQFRDVKEWRGALRKRGLTPGSVRRKMADDLRAVQWFLQQIDSQVQTTAEECRAYYQAHPESFSQPARFRASHLFLAAPPESPPEIVDQKREKIEALSKRIAVGEDFFELIAVESEDEQTKVRGGDLGFFSASRIPADFFSAVAKMEVGRISPPVRTRLGFHIVELTDLRPSRQLGFEEVEPEIALRIQNEKRQRLTPGFAAKLADAAEFLRALR